MKKKLAFLGICSFLLFALWQSARVLKSNAVAATELDASSFDTAALVSELNEQFQGIDPMTDDQVAHILRHAQNAKRSAVFVNAQWSPNSLVFRRRYSQLIAKYNPERRGDEILFHYLDCTETGFRQLSNLPARSDLSRYFLEGNGEILWIENGKLARIDSVTNSTADELIQSARSLVSESAG